MIRMVREAVSRGVVRHVIGAAIGVRFPDGAEAFPRDDLPTAVVGDHVRWSHGLYDTRGGQRVHFETLRHEPHPLADHGNGD